MESTMLAPLEALLAVQELGTMTRAATRLRISQSAVSKRVAALEHEVGARLLEREGRRVRLTPFAEALVERARPLLAELRATLSPEVRERETPLSIAVSESILASWGAGVLAAVRARLPRLRLELHAHRSPVAVDAVRSGRAALALVAGSRLGARDLVVEPLASEEMVIVPSGLARIVLRRGPLAVMTIEEGSATWRALRPAAAELARERGIELRVERAVESFACLVQLARAGLGHALVPRGIAAAMAVPDAALARLPGAGLWRPVSLVARKTTLGRPAVEAFCAALGPALGAVSELRRTA
ncbi:MAG TPA: LysR family transcriptional regulator [Myxococcota bacterium]|jgi:DNA-binding transcriptional LysR family regulator|nr:LysR family transcriptional regulator [Myxococcota bacterium]